MNSYEFKVGKHQFIIRKLDDGREEEAEKRAKKWLKDCEKFGKELDNLHAFADIEQLPKV